MELIQAGPRQAKIVLVGESPGKNEGPGRPFVGGAGELLNRMLSRTGIDRADCFVTNVCHVRPDKDKFDWFKKKVNQQHLVQGILQLKADLEEIRPNIVVALGANPLQILTGKIGIDKWRGSILPCTLVPDLKVIATYHPAYILRVYDYKVISEFDLRRIKEESLTPGISLPSYTFYLGDEAEQYTMFKEPVSLGSFDREAIVQEMLKAEWLSVDIECWDTPTGWKLACVGFSDRPDRALVIPAGNAWELALIKQLCESPVPKQVYQNGSFDITVLRNVGINPTRFTWDTMLGHHALFPECAGGADEISNMTGKKRQAAIRKGLAFQTSIYTRQPFYKDDGKLWKETGDVRMFWRYNALDAAVTLKIRNVQEEELIDFGTRNVLTHSMSLVEPLMAMTNRGIKIDTEVRASLSKQLHAEIDNLQAFLDAGAGRSINVKSPKDVPWLLYDFLHLPVQTNKKSRNPTADKDAINKLAGKSNNPLLHTVLRIREKRDLIERYLNAAVNNEGRMCCSFDITGTRSGRLSSRASLDGSGTNLQTIPEEIRRMFIADQRQIFVYRDYSQAEARIVAYLARAKGLIELFNDPTRDVHKENAARIFGVSVELVTKEQRYLAKRVIHASNYGMQPARLVEIVNEDAEITGIRITLQQARTLMDRYFIIYPEIREVFWKDIERGLKQTLTLSTPFGRKRTFYGRYDDKMLREAYSYIPQSTIGDLCCKALVRVYNEVQLGNPRWGVELLLNVHDSILVQCNEEHQEEVSNAMANCMNIPVVIDGQVVPIPTDCMIGHNWGQASESNPLGLREVT